MDVHELGALLAGISIGLVIGIVGMWLTIRRWDKEK